MRGDEFCFNGLLQELFKTNGRCLTNQYSHPLTYWLIELLCIGNDQNLSIINSIIFEISSSISRSLTGQLFTDGQIKSFTSNAIGRYFSGWFPQPKDERKARKRVEAAKEYIDKASSIITAMHSDLDSQTTQLDHLLMEIKKKKTLAKKYEELAETSQEKFSAFRHEMEEILREKIIEESGKGKRVRQAASFLIWSFTLILGAALGAYFKLIVAWCATIIN